MGPPQSCAEYRRQLVGLCRGGAIRAGYASLSIFHLCHRRLAAVVPAGRVTGGSPVDSGSKDIEKILGGNILRVWKQVEEVAENLTSY